MKFLGLIVLLFLNSPNIFSGELETILDLKQVLKIAKANNPTLLLAKEKENEIDAQKKLTTSYLFPSVSWSLNGNYQKDAVYTGTPKFSGDPYNLYTSDLKLSQTLFAYGSVSAIKQIEYQKKIQVLSAEIQERTLTQNVIQSFYQFILYQHSLENLLKTQEIIQKSLSTANERYRIGRGQLLDVLQVKTQLALLSPQIENAKNQLETSANQLTFYMGEKERSKFKLKGSLKTLLLKNIQKHIDLKNFRLPEYEMNKLQLEAMEYTKDVTYAKDFPTVKLVGDYLYNNYKKSELFSDYSHAWAVQLQLNIPLFSGFSSQYERQQLISQETQLYHSKHDLEDSLSLNQVTSLRNLQTAEASLDSAATAASLAEQSQNEAHRNYKLATIDFLQFLTVEQAALQAKTALDQLKYQSIIAYANYFMASGQSLSVLVDILSDEGMN